MACRESYATTCGGYIARTGTEQHCETFSSGPRPLGIDSLDAVVRAGLVTTRLALSFDQAGDLTTIPQIGGLYLRSPDQGQPVRATSHPTRLGCIG
jgi:hypothetical protein